MENKSLMLKRVKQTFLLLLLVSFFTSCSYKNFDGSTNFQNITDELVKESYKKYKKNIMGTVLVSDFVNLDKLKNNSKLGFLLSDSLKNSLLHRDIIVRQVELGRNFTLGKTGFNLLTRNSKKIQKEIVNISRHAVVGTYSITSKQLIVFIKLIDISNGDILSSSTKAVELTNEIRNLDKEKKISRTYAPLVL